jgi:hypothetical protein
MIPTRLEVSLVVDGIPPSPNEMRRRHWGARAKEAPVWRRAAYLAAYDALRSSGLGDAFPLRKAAVDLVFVSPAARGDLDNLVSSAKPILDGISRGLGGPGERGPLLYDDGVGCLEVLRARWRRGPRAAVEVTVREV